MSKKISAFQNKNLTIRGLNPAFVDNCCAMSEELLNLLRRNKIGADNMFYTFLVNTAALAVSDLMLDEERFIALCREQYHMYLTFHFENVGVNGHGHG